MGRRSSRDLWTAKLTGKGKLPPQAAGSVIGQRVTYEGVVLGIDPSLRGTGLAVVEFCKGKAGELLHSETIRMSPKLSLHQCIGTIANRVDVVLDDWPILHTAVEESIYVQNFQTAQILGTARGAAMAMVAKRNIEIFDYAPLRIKQAVVGFGRASKEQVTGMVKSQLNLAKELPSDESDAAAVAICHAMNLKIEV